jgi:hypothetical protein
MPIVNVNYPRVNDEVIAQINEWVVHYSGPVFRLVAGGRLVFASGRMSLERESVLSGRAVCLAGLARRHGDVT